MIKCLLFDLGGVMFHLNPMQFLHALEDKIHGSPQSAMTEFLESGIQFEYETGKIKSDVFYEKLSRFLHTSVDSQALIQAWNSVLTPVQSNLKLAAALKDSYQVVALSNTNATHAAYLEACWADLGIQPFHQTFYSHIIGSMKPDAAIYEHVIDKLKLEPASIFFIDDKETHVEAARAAGMSSAQLHDPINLRPTLEHAGIPLP